MSDSRPAASKAKSTTGSASGDRFYGYRQTDEFRRVCDLLAGDRASLAGLHGAAAGFLLAALAEDDRTGPWVVVTATQGTAEALNDELATFSGRPSLFFPPWESLFLADSVPDGDIFHDRVRVLRALELDQDERPAFVTAPLHAILQPIPTAAELSASIVRLAVGLELSRDDLTRQLTEAEFRSVPIVLRRGEFSVRGDIVDIFPFDAVTPLRVEYFGDTVESVREYDAQSQRSVPEGEIEECNVLLTPVSKMFRQIGQGEQRSLLDVIPDDSWSVIVEAEAIHERLHQIAHNILGDAGGAELERSFWERLGQRRTLDVRELTLGKDEKEAGTVVDFVTTQRFQTPDLPSAFESVAKCLEEGTAITTYCDSVAERRRVEEILSDQGIDPSRVDLRIGPVRRGFECRAARRVVLATRELFNRRSVRRARKLSAETRVVHSFFDLEEGDIVVHVSHGIGRYLGVTQMTTDDGVLQEYLTLQYRGGVKVHVPASKIDLVQKYIGSGGHVPALDRVGGTAWTKRRETVERAIVDFASELVEIQAFRQQKPGVAYPADDDWQRQFEASFPFDDTPDQYQATAAVKEDLRVARPMDRLLCGDVGYGKTEIAMRAAFKVVGANKQVVILVPTTVLAQQHCRTFRERMAGFPIRIEQLSRFCSPSQQREIVDAARRGEVDILIGTHRVLSNDVGFADLGLVVIDEEQRFGVAHKEKLKRLRATVEVLTMTATPIPRTLHMAFLGIRDISNLTTPPEGRSPIETRVIEFDRSVIRDAILRELNREGQVYFVHNRVKDIKIIRSQLQQLVPEATIEFAHGQMTENQLEDIMVRFLDQKIDVLVSTTIIESGIDIPNVNTIFINECDRFGLADLHQLRGRVGRSRHRAYCFVILPEHRRVNPDARKRIQSICEYSQLGAGFQIATRDLETRGAGNILGSQQSGHIAVVGYDFYCRLLERAVKQLGGKDTEQAIEVEIELAIEARIPESMVPTESGRLEIYRKVSKAADPEAVEEVAGEVADRYGPLPRPAINLIDLQLLRIYAAKAGIDSVSYDEHSIVLRCQERTQSLLDGCPLRAVVLEPRIVALVVNPPGKRRPVALTDEIVFQTMLVWLKTGKFPTPVGSRAALRKALGKLRVPPR